MKDAIIQKNDNSNNNASNETLKKEEEITMSFKQDELVNTDKKEINNKKLNEKESKTNEIEIKGNLEEEKNQIMTSEIEKRFDELYQKYIDIEKRIDEHARKTEENFRKLNERIEQTYTSLNESLGNINIRIGEFEEEVNRMTGGIGNAQNNYSDLIETKISINKLNEENNRCIICYEYFKDNDNAIFLPCFHVFHSKCINEWLKNKDNCPLCKIEIKNNLNNNC